MRCPQCGEKLRGAVERPLTNERDRGSMHVGNACYVRHVAVAEVMGECSRHGVVKAERLATR